MSRVLGLLGQPDDEVLGCGGTIACYSDSGGQVQVLFDAKGLPSHHDQLDRGQAIYELSDLEQVAQHADLIFGAQDVAA